MKAGLYARVSTHDQQTLPMQLSTMREYVGRRGWTVGLEISEIGSFRRIKNSYTVTAAPTPAQNATMRLVMAATVIP